MRVFNVDGKGKKVDRQQGLRRLHRRPVRRLPAGHHGRIWTSAGDGVHCYAPDGTLIGKVMVPEVVANVVLRRRQAQLPLHLRHDVALHGAPDGQRREDILISVNNGVGLWSPLDGSLWRIGPGQKGPTPLVGGSDDNNTAPAREGRLDIDLLHCSPNRKIVSNRSISALFSMSLNRPQCGGPCSETRAEARFHSPANHAIVGK